MNISPLKQKLRRASGLAAPMAPPGVLGRRCRLARRRAQLAMTAAMLTLALCGGGAGQTFVQGPPSLAASSRLPARAGLLAADKDKSSGVVTTEYSEKRIKWSAAKMKRQAA